MQCWLSNLAVVGLDIIVLSVAPLLRLISLSLQRRMYAWILGPSGHNLVCCAILNMVSKLLLLRSNFAITGTRTCVHKPQKVWGWPTSCVLFKLQGNVTHLRFMGKHKGFHGVSVPAQGTGVRKPQRTVSDL